MNVRMIDGQPFFVTREGKRESVLTPAEAIAEQEGIVAGALRNVAEADTGAAALRSQIEAALLAGEETASLRAELVALREAAQTFQVQADEAQQCIRDVHALLNRHEAATIREADAAQLTQLTAPYDTIIKEFA